MIAGLISSSCIFRLADFAGLLILDSFVFHPLILNRPGAILNRLVQVPS